MVKFSGNVVTVETSDLNFAVQRYKLVNFSVDVVDACRYHVSFPMTAEHREYFVEEIRFHNHQLKKEVDKSNTKPQNDPTPPKGTPPRGGGGKVVELHNTVAVAA